MKRIRILFFGLESNSNYGIRAKIRIGIGILSLDSIFGSKLDFLYLKFDFQGQIRLDFDPRIG